MFIDTHCHLNFKAFNKDLPEIIKRAKKAGVAKIIIPGAKIDSSRQAIRIAKKYSCCFAAVGIHPHHVQSILSKDDKFFNSKDTTLLYSNVVKEISFLINQSKTVAVGEIGLDYYHYKNYSPISETDKEKQKELFLTQIKIAQRKNLPVIIHCRKAHDDLLDLLTNHIQTSDRSLSGIFHCFAGNETHLKKILNLGFFVGFNGNISYPENNHLRKLVRLTPLKSLLLETDAPFLTPCPYRNTRNEPSYLPIIASMVAEIHKETVEKIAESSSSNAIKLFRL